MKKILTIIMAMTLAAQAAAVTASAGWVSEDGETYYQNSDGSYRTGWIKTSSGDYYYCLKDGRMAKGCTVTVGGVKYKFDSSGKAVNKPEEKPAGGKNGAKTEKKTEETGAVKNQNTFPSLVTYGVYCGMTAEEFHGLKNFENFQWDYDEEAYIIDQNIFVTITDGRVSVIQRGRMADYGYRTRDGYKDMDSAERAVESWRTKMLKVHKDKEVISDTTTESTFTDGLITYATEDSNVVYVMSDVRWDSGDDTFSAFEGYIYVGEE